MQHNFYGPKFIKARICVFPRMYIDAGTGPNRHDRRRSIALFRRAYGSQ